MLLLASFGTFIITFGIVTVSILMIGLIMLQKNRGAGLSGAFGGVGGYSAFGTKTGDFLTWVTVGLVTLFLLLNIVGTYVFEPTTIDTGAAAAGGPVQVTPSGLPAGQNPVQATPVNLPTPAEGESIKLEVPAQPPAMPAQQPTAAPAQPAPTTQPA